MSTLEQFWASQEQGYKYLCNLPPMRTRLNVPPLAVPIVDKLKSAGTLFVVSPEKYDRQDIEQKRIGSSTRYRNYPPVIWINVALSHKVAAFAASRGIYPETELIDTIFHEAAHVTGHYLNRVPTATEPLSTFKDIQNEEAICHLVTAELWRQAGNKLLAKLNMDQSRQAAKRIGKSLNALSRETDAAIDWLTTP